MNKQINHRKPFIARGVLATLSLSLAASLLAACSSDSAQSASAITGGTVTPSPEINITLDGTPTAEINITLDDTPTAEINLIVGGTATTEIVNTLPTETPGPPTSTPRPSTADLAARVNDQDITLVRFNAEINRYIASDPGAPPPDSPEGKELAAQLKDNVLDALIDQALIEQEATRLKIAVTEQQVEEEIAALMQIRGGRESFDAWLAANQQTERDVRESVRHELLAATMRDRIIEQLPRTAEYVHAFHIVVATQPEAESVLARLQDGAKFAALAQSLSIDDSTRPNGGDMGWFTRSTGSVLWTEVEDAAFSLKPGQLSEVIPSPIGYHIIKVVDRQTRALTAEDMAHVQQTALEQWLARLRTNANIEKFI